MSAIFGILRFDGGEVSARDLERMSNALVHRGPDGRKFAVKGCAGLGHCLLRVNREDSFEAQPLHDDEAGLTLVADLRLDNRDELGAIFGLSAPDLRDMPDSALVLHAYKMWDDDCAAHLLGDFAFAVWDERARKLTIARDHMGQRQVYYYRGDRFLAFATEQNALWSLPDVPQVFSERNLVRVLVVDKNRTPGDTLFERVYGLVGGTTMTVDRHGSVTARRYWEPHADPAHLGRDEAYYVAAYRRVLEEAVTCRLRRASYPAGLFFSGGFDSGAIAALAGPALRAQGRSLIAVCSALPGEGYGERDPRPWVELCRRDMPHLDVRYTGHEGLSVLTGLEKAFAQGNPPGLRHFAHDDMYRIIASAGARLAMDGHGGDYTLNPRGHFALAGFLVRGQWRRFAAEIGPWQRQRKQALLQTVLADVVAILLAPMRAAWGRYREGLRPFGPMVPVTPALAREAAGGGAVFGGSFAARPGLSMRRWIATILREQQNAAGAGNSPLAAMHKLDFTRPFHDKRVVELALAVPEDLYVKAGRPRALAYAALADLLPPEFRDRPATNQMVAPDPRQTAKQIAPQLLADIARMEKDARLARYFDFPRMRRIVRRSVSNGTDGGAGLGARVLHSYVLARYIEWFRRSNS